MTSSPLMDVYHLLFDKHSDYAQRHRLGFRHKVRFFLRYIGFYRLSNQWWSYLLATPSLKALLNKTPYLTIKPHRPYLHAKWNAAQRVQTLQAHYSALRHHSHLRHAHDSTFPLLAFNAADTACRIDIEVDPRFQREGELCLTLYMENERLYSLAFTLNEENHELQAFIGSFQGGQNDCPEKIKKMTKALNGFRTKALLLWVFMRLFESMGGKKVYAIDDANHIHQSYKFTNKKVPTTYAEFWKENNGTLEKNGFWALPLTESRKALEDISANKRAMYNRRYQWMEEIKTKIAEAIHPSQET